jgi:hypothetical protein
MDEKETWGISPKEDPDQTAHGKGSRMRERRLECRLAVGNQTPTTREKGIADERVDAGRFM